MMDFGEKYSSRALSLLRIVTALLFIEHGTSKILDWPHTSMSGPPTGSLFWVAGLLELVGGALLLAGLFTRSVAFLLAGEMAVAYWMIHAPQAALPLLNQGEAAVLYCFIFLLFVATGPGEWSVDRMIRREDDEEGVEGYAAPGGERQYREEDFGDKII